MPSARLTVQIINNQSQVIVWINVNQKVATNCSQRYRPNRQCIQNDATVPLNWIFPNATSCTAEVLVIILKLHIGPVKDMTFLHDPCLLKVLLQQYCRCAAIQGTGTRELPLSCSWQPDQHRITVYLHLVDLRLISSRSNAKIKHWICLYTLLSTVKGSKGASMYYPI